MTGVPVAKYRNLLRHDHLNLELPRANRASHPFPSYVDGAYHASATELPASSAHGSQKGQDSHSQSSSSRRVTTVPSMSRKLDRRKVME